MEENKLKNEGESGLSSGDVAVIAGAAPCTPRQVNYLIKGGRGKRNTPLQQFLREAIQLRQKQNQELIQFCQTNKVKLVTPQK